MYVRDRMTDSPYIVTPEATIAETFELMKEKKIRRVPVIHHGKLVGIITKRKLMEVSPSQETSLSIFELNYLLSKTKVESVMHKDVITVTPSNLLEEAAVLMREHKIGGLPVVENGKLVGIITETDIFDSFVELLGYRDSGSRIAVEVEEDRPGVLAKLAEIIAGFGLNISHLVVFRNEVIIRVNTVNVRDLLDAFAQNGFKVNSVIKNT